MVTLENKAEMLAAQLRQRIGVQRGNILTGDAIGAAGGLIQAAENIHQGRFTGTRSADNRHHLTGINIEERVEKGLKEQYTPRMKKLSFAQGKLLIKLIDRQSHQSSYELVKAFMGPFKAGFYQTFAALFGASLKKQYDPEGEDKLTERVILLVESGQL